MYQKDRKGFGNVLRSRTDSMFASYRSAGSIQSPTRMPTSPVRTGNWKAALLPEVDWRYRQLRLQGIVRERQPPLQQLVSQLSLLSNSPQKHSKLSYKNELLPTLCQQTISQGMGGNSCSWATYHEDTNWSKFRPKSDLSTDIRLPAEVKQNRCQHDQHEIQLEYLQEEVHYLRKKFLSHFEKCSQNENKNIIKEEREQANQSSQKSEQTTITE